ncbi:MAG TPA: xylulokinase [Ktedonobacterales bacterium]|nr:xylulokinase [Ktedonobacterales bacterium]
MDTLLGLDIGTTGAKAALFAADDGRTLASAFVEYPLYHPAPGWAEQDPEDWWRATCAAIQTCLAQAKAQGINPEKVRGLGLSGQMHGLVLLDEQDQVLRRCIIWADQRSAAECDWITQAVGAERLIDLTSNPALTGFTAPKALWVRNHEPELFARAAHLLLPKDYIRYRLTGVMAMEITDAAGTLFLDVRQGVWSAELLELIGVKPSLLPPVRRSIDVCGEITPAVAALTGLRAGTPVAGGGADNACGAVGSGVVEPGLVLLSLGTSGVVLAHAASPSVDRSGPVPRAHTFNHSVPNTWYLMAVTQAAGLSFRWVRDNFGLPEMAMERWASADAYELLSAEAAGAPVGAEGLLFLPYLQGERAPHLDPAARGGWIGLTARHDRRAIIRAVLEGVAYSLKDCFAIIREQGLPIEQVRVTGGGAKGTLWRQILADVLETDLVTTQAQEGPSFGAALLAGVAAGVYPTVEAACHTAVRLGGRTTPDAANVRTYQQYYPVYQALYPALKASFARLSAISEGAHG